VCGVQERAARQVTGRVVVWPLVAAVAQVVAFEAVRRGFAGTRAGQWLDEAAFVGHEVAEDYYQGLADAALNTMTVLSLVVLVAAVGVAALAGRRVVPAIAAALLVVGANLSTQVLKSVIDRPALGIEAVHATGNTLPSGHTTVAASVAVALVWVLPRAWRERVVWVGAGYAALAGVATLSVGWHRPSDVVAALLVVGVWATTIGALLAAWRRRAGAGDPPPAPRRVPVALALAGVGLLAAGAVVLALAYQGSTPVEELDDGRLFAAYLGGVAAIAGAAGLVMSLVVAIPSTISPET
jgi:membrane-associated phospholipid phosphatase